MRHRDVDTIEDAVSRLLPRLTPSAVLMTGNPGDAVGVLSRALGEPRALDSPGNALDALARHALHRPRWSAEQVIESLPAAPPSENDPALADALRALPDRDRAAVVPALVAGLTDRNGRGTRERGCRRTWPGGTTSRNASARGRRHCSGVRDRHRTRPGPPRNCRNGSPCWLRGARSRRRPPR